ncbi:aromatic acid exporter family protein [Synechococcus sp. Cruz CV12-2-Slac-r]|uniref:FUSC family protein n=1 Tax=Synechococcus sp. Cruz CV12-2-Slac-r TaxID=2823748 RepID=UPI0020CBEED5|nr:FUSC family protein [Synechococcus sp. Cruz CV12-2-Slac-r]MCP9939752.1 FUSC family protein [Synechococcus sp. Cruz CV12-2-Slac-r]
MTAELNQQALKNAIKYFVAAAIAGSIALATDQVIFIWYPLLAVVMCMDETETQVIAASRGRMLGTVAAGVVGFFVHTVLQGWVALTISLLILVPILRWCRWQAGLATGVVLLSMLFLVAEYSSLDWLYILNRTIDTLIGVLVAILVSNLLWPINRLAEIYSLDLKLRQLLSKRLLNIQQLLFGTASAPEAQLPLEGSRLIGQLSQLVNDELRSRPHGAATRNHWRQRCILWERVNHHSMQLLRLISWLPATFNGLEQGPWLNKLHQALNTKLDVTELNSTNRRQLLKVASQTNIPPLLLLAVEDELHRLISSIKSLQLASNSEISA